MKESYESIPAITKIPLLIQLMTSADASIESRTMSAVLLRRLFSNSFEDFWPTFAPELTDQIKQSMLCFAREPNAIIRKKMCECTAEFARNMLGEGLRGTFQSDELALKCRVRSF